MQQLITKRQIFRFILINNVSEYAKTAVRYAVGKGLMKGKTEQMLYPSDTITRAEISAVLERFVTGNN